jgi:hypothetical protein
MRGLRFNEQNCQFTIPSRQAYRQPSLTLSVFGGDSVGVRQMVALISPDFAAS